MDMTSKDRLRLKWYVGDWLFKTVIAAANLN